MKVLVCGGRDYNDAAEVFACLDRLHRENPITCIIHGDAFGCDRLAGYWGQDNDIEVKACPADWAKHGRAAGPIRNREMLLLYPDVVIAFPGGRGTADMIRQAIKAMDDPLGPSQVIDIAAQTTKRKVGAS